MGILAIIGSTVYSSPPLPGSGATVDNLLMESGFNLLLEDGFVIVLE